MQYLCFFLFFIVFVFFNSTSMYISQLLSLGAEQEVLQIMLLVRVTVRASVRPSVQYSQRLAIHVALRWGRITNTDPYTCISWKPWSSGIVNILHLRSKVMWFSADRLLAHAVLNPSDFHISWYLMRLSFSSLNSLCFLDLIQASVVQCWQSFDFFVFWLPYTSLYLLDVALFCSSASSLLGMFFRCC